MIGNGLFSSVKIETIDTNANTNTDNDAIPAPDEGHVAVSLLYVKAYSSFLISLYVTNGPRKLGTNSHNKCIFSTSS